MFNRLVIVGAGGHGKVIADIAIKIGYTDIVFIDDNAIGDCLGYPIVGTCEIIESLNDNKNGFVIAVGNNKSRRRIAEQHNVNWVSLIHPSAQIGADVKIGVGTVIMANTVLNPCSTVGKHCIINTSSVIEHDNVIGDYVHISPQVALGGTVRIGDGTHIGIGAVVRNNITVCNDCTVGAGAVVIKNITESAMYIGVPAKMMTIHKSNT